MGFNRLGVLLVVLVFAGGCVATPPQVNRTVQVAPDVSLGFVMPSERWKVVAEVPEFLVEERAEHIEHELQEQGKKVSREDVLKLARKRLAANELFIFNPQTGAVLEVDFSPLKEGEFAPSKGTVASSARFAGDSLSQEEGVSGASSSTAKARVHGAMAAYRLDAAYQQHGHDTKFVGIVGFSDPYWFYLYYTDPLKDARDYEEMDSLLKNLLLQTGKGR